MNEHLRRFNLNLLPILDALLDTRNVTRAGERFDLTQPAASAALAKLRAAFGDELLVPVGRDLRLTPKAERIREPVRQLLELLETAFQSNDLDPAGWSGEFIMATADAVAALVLPSLIDKLDKVAPGLTLRVTNITRSSVSNLRSEDIDMIVAPPQIIDDAALMSRRLFSDRFVVVHSKDHPPPPQHELSEYMKRGHIATVIDAPHIGGPPRSYFSAEIDQLRSTQRNVAVVPYYSLLPLLVSGTSRLALVQERLAKRLMEFLPVSYVDPPSPLPPLDLHMFWSPKYNDDPRHVWLRNSVFEACEPYRT
ncbi:LysR substrate-binding domain-containing protein [Steroidobacter flavus]|uniref:LysR substrate-binding domain-containing protein n=1 Tax=Steroidobacter flavus TaxID=1842136 RepID=A0ABV8SKV7_9GAMM